MPEKQLVEVRVDLSGREMDFLGLKNTPPAEQSGEVENRIRDALGWPRRELQPDPEARA